MMKGAKALVTIEVNAECPHCSVENDLMMQENDLTKGNTLPDPGNISDWIYWCKSCQGEFKISELEY